MVVIASLKYKTKDDTSPNGKPNIYFCCHPADFEKYFEKIASEIHSIQNCVIWYADETTVRNEDFWEELQQMQLFILPVTTNLLCTQNATLDIDFPFAQTNHIPVLPLMQERGLEKIFTEKCGQLHFLDSVSRDITAVDYNIKLKKYLSSVLFSAEIESKIRSVFDAYVFLSYRKIDRKYANILLKSIHHTPEYRNIAVWFDEFLIPGESFKENIENLLSQSKLFALLVTPRIIQKNIDEDGNEKDNYVISTELPLAKRKRKEDGTDILAVVMEETDKGILQALDVDDCLYFKDKEFQAQLSETLSRIGVSPNDTPQHNFFLGLAYLNGIDVEINREIAVDLISQAAASAFEPAVNKLADMYYRGEGVDRDISKALEYYQKLCTIQENTFRESGTVEAAETWIDSQCLVGDLFLEARNNSMAEYYYNELVQNCKKMQFPTFFSWQGRALLRGPRKCPYALYGKAIGNMGLAKVMIASGRKDDAEDKYYAGLDALEDYEDLAYDHNKLDILEKEGFQLCYADIQLGLGNPQKALEILSAIRTDISSDRVNHLIYLCHINLGEECTAKENYEAATVHYEKAMDALYDIRNNLSNANHEILKIDLAKLSMLCGELILDTLNAMHPNRERFDNALFLAEKDPSTGNWIKNPEAYGTKGYYEREDAFTRATDSFQRAVNILQEYLHSPTLEVADIASRSLWGLSQISKSKKHRQQAIESLRQACDILQRLPTESCRHSLYKFKEELTALDVILH